MNFSTFTKSFGQLKLHVFALVLGATFSQAATSAILIEPHLAYNLHTSYDVAGDGEYSYNGAQYGLKLGYQNLGFMAGIDFTRSSYTLKNEDSSGTSKQDFNRNEIGAFLGYNFPILFRVWGAYYFSTTAKADAVDMELTGSTKEIGVGYTGLPFLSLNFMFRMVDLDEVKSAGVKLPLNPEHSAKEFVVGVSLPITL